MLFRCQIVTNRRKILKKNCPEMAKKRGQRLPELPVFPPPPPRPDRIFVVGGGPSSNALGVNFPGELPSWTSPPPRSPTFHPPPKCTYPFLHAPSLCPATFITAITRQLHTAPLHGLQGALLHGEGDGRWGALD